MQPMSSMQTALLPGVTPGWNDPPPLGNPASGSRLNRYRRVVDPSLSAAGGSPAPYAASPQQGMPPMGAPQGYPSPHQPLHQVQYPQQQPQQIAYPQQAQQLQYAQPVPMQQPVMQQPHMYMQQPMQPQQQYAQPDYSMPFEDSSISRQEQQRSLTQLMGGPGGDTSLLRTAHCAKVNQQNDWGEKVEMAPLVPIVDDRNPADRNRLPAGNNARPTNQGTSHDQERNKMLDAVSNKQPDQPSRSSNNDNLDEGSYNLPGVVPDFSNLGIYDPAIFKVPQTTPGNVSMSASFIFKCMIGASHKLIQLVPYSDEKAKGVQMMIKDMESELEQAGQAFIFAFNHVADSINVENYAAAERQLNQVVSDYPAQTHDDNRVEKKWIRGIRFLINELKK